MEKYGTDVVAETKEAIAELEGRLVHLVKTASEGEMQAARDMIEAAKAKLKELQSTAV